MIVSKKQMENLKGWVEDLESGEYKQCRHKMQKIRGSQESFCCLGVAVHRLEPSSPVLGYAMPNIGWMEKNYGVTLHQCTRLSELNDRSLNFEPTANVIKEYIEKATVQ